MLLHTITMMLKKIILAAVLSLVLLTTNVVSAFAKEQSLGYVAVLMYHNIVNNPRYASTFAISKEQFEEDLKYLKECGYVSVTPHKLCAYVDTSTKLPKKTVMITFDDGYLSALNIVLPLLKKYDFDAVFAVVGSYANLGKSNPDCGKVFAYLEQDDIKELSLSGYAEIASHSYALHSNKLRRGVAKKYGESSVEYKKMFLDDLKKNEDFLKGYAPAPICFAYPFGRYCAESEEVLKQNGYRMTLSCNEGINEISGCESLYLLKRLNRTNRRNAQTAIEKYLKS